MDLTGTLMGAATIPMLLLNLGSFGAALWLLGWGDFRAVAIGVLLTAGGMLGARLVGNRALAGDAPERRARGDRLGAWVGGTVAATWPLTLILGWQLLCFHLLVGVPEDRHDPARWLFCYGVANLPWLWRAHRAPPSDKTLAGIQAYAAQISFVILSAARLWFELPLPPALVVALAPMSLPFVVALLLAVADRATLRDVQG